MTPLGDAVRLVDGDELDGQALQPLAERFIGEALRGDVEQLESAHFQPPIDVADLLSIQRRVQPRGGNPLGSERVHLIAHQGDERGNHKGEAVE